MTTERNTLHTGTMIVLQHEIYFKAPMPEKDAHMIDHTEGIEQLESHIHDTVQEQISKEQTGGEFEYIHQDGHLGSVTLKVEWYILHDPFQLGVMTVLQEFVKRADECLENKEIATHMMIPIDDVKKFRDAVDTAQDVLFS